MKFNLRDPDEEKFKLKVVRGPFKGDYWLFSSIEEIDLWLEPAQREGWIGLVAPGTMEILERGKNRRWSKVSDR